MKSFVAALAVCVLVTAACSSNTGSSNTGSSTTGSSNAGTTGNGAPAAEQPSTGVGNALTSIAPATANKTQPNQPDSAAALQPAESPSAKSSAPAAEATPPAPKFKEVTIPSGTTLSMKLQTSVASNTSKVEDKVRATLNKPLLVNGTTAVPVGAEVVGSVREVQESGRVKGRASIAFRFDRLSAWKETYSIQTAQVTREAEATKGEDAKKVGIGAGAGALVGAIAGGKKGAAVGGLVGAGAGTGVVMATKGEEVQLPSGTVVTAKLTESLRVTVPLE